MNPQKLKLSRTAAGLSLRDLEDRLGKLVTAQAIGKYERGEALPREEVLEAIARALNVPASFLLQSDPPLRLVALEFRHTLLSSERDKQQVSAEITQHLQAYLQIEEILQISSANWNAPRGWRLPVREISDAETAARQVRSHWNLGMDPIPRISGFSSVLEENGIKVIAAELPQAISGFTGWVECSARGRIPFIAINRNDTGERQRFTLAHELGHIMIDSLEPTISEKAANRFAGAFLMPVEVMWLEIGKHRTHISLGELFALKEYLGVSVQALTYRCKDLGIISQAEYKSLFDTYRSSGWLGPPYEEPVKLEKEIPKRFYRLCLRALSESAISEEQAAHLLKMNRRDLAAVLYKPHSTRIR